MSFEDKDMVALLPQLKKFALRLCRDGTAADDLVQDTVLRMLEKRNMFETGTSLWSWAGKIMFNIFAGQYRRRKKFESGCDPELVLMMASEAPSQEVTTFARQVAVEICKMPGEMQAIIVAVVEGGSYEDAAAALSVPMGTIRSRLSRARARLEGGIDQLRIATDEVV